MLAFSRVMPFTTLGRRASSSGSTCGAATAEPEADGPALVEADADEEGDADSTSEADGEAAADEAGAEAEAPAAEPAGLGDDVVPHAATSSATPIPEINRFIRISSRDTARLASRCSAPDDAAARVSVIPLAENRLSW
jgi:hypothetical protein